MRHLVLRDLHAHLEALQAVLADARSVSAAEAAGNGLGLVTGRALPLNEILLREVPQ